MKEYYIVPQYSKIRRQTAQKRVLVENVIPNLLKRNFTVNEPDKAWVTDITYIIHNRKRLFLSTIIDLYDRQVVSCKIHTINDIPLDNGVIESFHARLKNEFMYNKEFKNIDELKQAIFDWIWFYNHGRIKGKRKTIEYINYKEKYGKNK